MIQSDAVFIRQLSSTELPFLTLLCSSTKQRDPRGLVRSCHLLGQFHSQWTEVGPGCVLSRMLLGPLPAKSASQPVGSHGILRWGHCETGAQPEAGDQN